MDWREGKWQRTKGDGKARRGDWPAMEFMIKEERVFIIF